MNILISSAGRQSYLVTGFKEALNNKGKVIVADINVNAPALKEADIPIISPSYDSNEYLPWLYDVCEKHKIKLLITLNVDELLILEFQRESLKKIGAFLLGGDYEKIKITYDKLALSKFAEGIGLDTPKVFCEDDLCQADNTFFPLIVKPRFGKGSRGQYIIESYEEFLEFMERNKTESIRNEAYVFQQFIRGDEFGIDVINDFHSNYVSTFVRKKYSMKDGETFEATTQSSEEWEEIARKIGENIRHQGIVDVDFMVQNKKKYLIDINHRFGGGYIFSHAAGANLPCTFVSWLMNSNIDEKWLHPIPEICCQRHEISIKIKEKS